jgi:hypothetical protein
MTVGLQKYFAREKEGGGVCGSNSSCPGLFTVPGKFRNGLAVGL